MQASRWALSRIIPLLVYERFDRDTATKNLCWNCQIVVELGWRDLLNGIVGESYWIFDIFICSFVSFLSFRSFMNSLSSIYLNLVDITSRS